MPCLSPIALGMWKPDAELIFPSLLTENSLVFVLQDIRLRDIFSLRFVTTGKG